MASETVVFAILAKDKAHCLPTYLQCLENQSFPAAQTRIWVRTNNNNDATSTILKAWIEKVRSRYLSIHFDDSDVPEPVQKYSQHEWNTERFKVLGAIRQASVDYASKHKAHYFVADCDNFIGPTTIEDLLKTNLPVIGPLLRSVKDGSLYANYHLAVDASGYYLDHKHYRALLEREVVGIFEVPVIHCTYLIRKEILDAVVYDDGSSRYEYCICSDSLRRANVPQYLDNRKHWGYLTFATTKEELEQESWWPFC
jgi:hypothetical protein